MKAACFRLWRNHEYSGNTMPDHDHPCAGAMPGPAALLRLTAALSLLAALAMAPLQAAFAQAKPTQGLRQLVAAQAAAHGVPVALAHAVVTIESNYRPRVVSKGNYGLMQIRLGTARAMGFRGAPRDLLDPAVNTRYAMRYLGRAWRSAGGDVCRTIQRYQTGSLNRRMPAATRAYCARAKRLMTSSRRSATHARAAAP